MTARMNDGTSFSTKPPLLNDWECFLNFIRADDTESVRKWFGHHQIPDTETLGCQFPTYLPDPVYEAVTKGNFVIFDLLVQNGFRTDRITYKNMISAQPVHVAAEKGHLEILRKLISECDISVDTLDNWNRTPLRYAVSGAHTPVVDYLVSKGADVNYCPSGVNSSPPIVAALSQGNTDLAQHLLSHGANINQIIPPKGCLLNFYVSFGNFSIVEWLHKNGAKTDIYGTKGKTVFHFAMNTHFNLRTVKFLIGINVPLNQLTSEGHTALHGVLHNTHSPALSDCLKLIVDAGFRVTQKDYDTACQIWATDTDLLLVKQLESYLSHPRSLQQLCCFSIREILGTDLRKLVEDLPVPYTIKEYIRLDHLVNS